MTINFGDLMKTAEQEGGLSLLPDGDYNVTVTKAESVLASTGKPMIKVTYTVTDGQAKGRKLFNNHVLVVDSPPALAMLFKQMAAYGLDKTFWTAPGASFDAAAPLLIGRPATVDVGHKVYKGEDRNEVKFVKPPSTGVSPIIGGGPSMGAGINVPNIPGPSAPVVTAPATVSTPQPVSGSVPDINPVTPVPSIPAGNNEEPF